MNRMRRHIVSFATVAVLATTAYFWSALQPDTLHAAGMSEAATSVMGAGPAPAAPQDPFAMEKHNAPIEELPPQF